MDTLATWWHENAVPFVLGSLAWTGAAAIVIRWTPAPLLRQRLAETAIAGWFLWLACGFVPREAVASEPVRITVASQLGMAAVPGDAPAASGSSALPTLLDTAGVVLLVGMLLAASYLLVAASLLGRLLFRAVPAPVAVTRLLESLPLRPFPRARVLASDLAWRPFCCGLVWPRIVLPHVLLQADAPRGEASLRAVLLHELAHLMRGDLRGRTLFALAMPLQFWNPLFWGLRRCAGDAAELLADEVAAGHHRQRAGYARSLIDLAEWLPAAREGRVTALGVLGPEVRFHDRMTMLLQRHVPLTIRCSRLQTVLRSAAGVALALVASACWTGPTVEPAPETTAAAVDDDAPRVYFAFREAEVGQVIDTIAHLAGANIVIAPEVVGTVNLECRGVPWRTALELVVGQVGARVIREDRGILRITRPAVTSQLRVEASAVEIPDTTPLQVVLEVRLAAAEEVTTMPKIVLVDGQRGSLFVGNADTSGSETGVRVEVAVAGGRATLDVAKREQGRIVDSQRLEVPVTR